LFDLPPFPVAEERPDLMESLSPEQSAESIDAADTSNDE
jgi:hypothetical protein